MAVLLVPVFVVLVLVSVDLWVLADARKWARGGTPVVFRFGALRVETPESWFVACLVLWVLFFPIYMAARRG